jgi:hypothetical protein
VTALPDCHASNDSYQNVFACAKPALVKCFATGDARADLVIEIARDGHVTRVSSHRLEPDTAASRCLVATIEKLRFPASETSLSLLVPFVAR